MEQLIWKKYISKKLNLIKFNQRWIYNHDYIKDNNNLIHRKKKEKIKKNKIDSEKMNKFSTRKKHFSYLIKC